MVKIMPSGSQYIHCAQMHRCMLTELNRQKILSSKSAAYQNWPGRGTQNLVTGTGKVC